MTFEEIDKQLPNGFHDAKIRKINADLLNCSIRIEMDIHVGVPEDEDRERYQTGVLKVTSSYLFFIEPPDSRYRFMPNGSAFNVDGDSVKLGQSPDVDRLLPVLPQGYTAYRFFLEEWNSFLYLAGASVEFLWDDATG